MKRTYEEHIEHIVSEEITIELITKITYKPRKKLRMDKEIIPEGFDKWNSLKKGEWLEDETKNQLEQLGFTTTITKSYTWTKNEEQEFPRRKILGDNGIDGIARKKINGEIYQCIVQCKCYKKTTPISTDVIQHLDNNVSQWKTPGMFGLLVVKHKESLNKRAMNAIANALNPIIVVEIEKMQELPQLVKDIKWTEYPSRQLKRTRLRIEEADEIENVGEVTVRGKKIKNLTFAEDTLLY